MDLKAQREAEMAQKRMASTLRKQKMLELSEHAKKNAQLSDVQIAAKARATQLRKAGKDKMDENSDVVKTLMSYGTRAAAFTIRDKQLQDRHEREKQEEEYNRRMDTLMEIDRIQDIQRREAEERAKKAKRISDRSVINEQIAERERQKMIAAEMREQENMAMKELLKKYEEEDAAKAEQRSKDSALAQKQLIAANEDAIRRKLAAREAEKKEMEDILVYQAMNDAKLAKREAEEEAVALIKKEQQKKLLAQQEKSNNKQVELDELRARRAAEENERRARRKEREEALKRKNDTLVLLESRRSQEASKREKLARERAREEEEHIAHLAHANRNANRDADEAARKQHNNNRQRELLAEQIRSDEARRNANSGSNLAEGARAQQELIADQAKFETIREQMIRDLEHKGVNPRYLSEMRNLNIGKLLRR